MRHCRQALLAAACGVLVLSLPGRALAQGYPSKPVRMVVPYPPGGGSDTVSRPLAQRLSERFGQPVLIDNRGGASGNIGMEVVARAPADGYTLVFALSAQLAVNPNLFEKLPYDPVADFAPIALVATGSVMIAVHPSLPVRSVADLIALARARPDTLTYGTSGNGSAPHLSGELFSTMAGIRMVHVPYKGGGAALSDTIAGHVQVVFSPLVTAAPHVKSGRLRALAVTTSTRASGMPDLPTVEEAGVKGYESSFIYGVLAPAGTGREVIDRVNAGILQVLKEPGYRGLLANNGIEPGGSTPEELGAIIRADIVKWARVIKLAKVKP